MINKNKNIIIIGGGIIGLSIARKMLNIGYKNLTVLEKEGKLASHQSGRNSGVMHAGLYYKPNSLKARLSRKGINLMKNYCDKNSIKWEECGKIVVATTKQENYRLEELYQRGKNNGLKGIKMINQNEINKIEPYVNANNGILVPEESIVDYKEVSKEFEKEIVALGGNIKCSSEVISRSTTRSTNLVNLKNGDSLPYDLLICSTGLYSDKTAKMFDIDIENKKIIPFRGEYFLLKPQYSYLVNSLIYPVPNPSFPFLGVHFTKLINGQVEAGPNAVLALAREGYTWKDINLKEFYESITYIGLQKFLFKYPLTTTSEIIRSLSKMVFLKSLKKLVPDLRSEMIIKGQAGIRAQLMTSNGVLEQDFDIRINDKCISILNAPSPAATSCLSIADYLVELLEI